MGSGGEHVVRGDEGLRRTEDYLDPVHSTRCLKPLVEHGVAHKGYLIHDLGTFHYYLHELVFPSDGARCKEGGV